MFKRILLAVGLVAYLAVAHAFAIDPIRVRIDEGDADKVFTASIGSTTAQKLWDVSAPTSAVNPNPLYQKVTRVQLCNQSPLFDLSLTTWSVQGQPKATDNNYLLKTTTHAADGLVCTQIVGRTQWYGQFINKAEGAAAPATSSTTVRAKISAQQ